MKQAECELNGERQRATRYPLELGVLLLFLVTAWAGCKREPKVVADPNPVGTYALVSVNGNTGSKSQAIQNRRESFQDLARSIRREA
jgi:hypothetical protein